MRTPTKLFEMSPPKYVVQFFFVSLWLPPPFTTLLDFRMFSRSYEATKFYMIRRCLDVSEVIPMNMAFWSFWLMLFCFVATKDHLRKRRYFAVNYLLSAMLLFFWCYFYASTK